MINKILFQAKRNKIVLLAILVVISFYWYSLRPYLIVKKCIQLANDKVDNIRGDQTDVRYFFGNVKNKMAYLINK